MIVTDCDLRILPCCSLLGHFSELLLGWTLKARCRMYVCAMYKNRGWEGRE